MGGRGSCRAVICAYGCTVLIFEGFIIKTTVNYILFFAFSSQLLIASSTHSVPNETSLPESGVLFTFDDRFISQWSAQLPLFAKYNAHATFFISGFHLLDASQIATLHTMDAAGHAIGCHSVNHYNAVDYVNQHGLAEYLSVEVDPAIAIMKSNGFNPTCFAYPSSARNDEIDQAMLERFGYLRSGTGLPTGDTISDLDIIYTPVTNIVQRRSLIGTGIDYAGTDTRPDYVIQIKAALDRAKANQEIVVFYAHNISEPTSGHHIQPDALEEILAYTQTIGIKTLTYDDLAKALPDSSNLPIADTFEDFTEGQTLTSDTGWSGVFGTTVKALSYTAQTPPGTPQPTAAHTKALRLYKSKRRSVNGSENQNVNIDMMLKAERAEKFPDDPDSGAQAGFCIDSNGVLYAWHMSDAGGDWIPRWSPLGMPPVAEGQWVRISASMDYTSNADGDTFFCPRVHGSLCPTSAGYKAPDNLISPGPWYMCANSPGRGGAGTRKVSSLVLNGRGWVDDVTVSTNELAHSGATSTNGVPFVWFDSWGVARLPDSDFDGDGFSAVQEYASGSNPSDIESCLKIVRSWTQAENIYIQFVGNDSGSDTPFVVECATNGLDGGWSVLDSSVARVAAPQLTNTWSGTRLQSSSAFYRIRAPASM